MLRFLDVLYLWLHIIIIVFNLFGWIWRRTRRAHLLFVGITLFSWIILGFRYGFGYCFLTDWHWHVKYKLGEYDLPTSFIKYAIDQYTFFKISPATADYLTGITFFTAIIISIYLNLFHSRAANR